jgi:hypothetical protein
MTKQWWGYLHTNGSVQVKPYFDRQDVDEAMESPFVQGVYRPFLATSREDALAHVAKLRAPSESTGP